MRPDGPRAPVAIVGGGFSGTMLAAQLARRGIASLLIEGGGRAGLGAAYSTDEPAHVLNVRAEAMSAWPDAPDHFARQTGDPQGFAERREFGRYLRAILDQAIGTGLVELVAKKAVAAARRGDGWHVDLEPSGAVAAQALVFAIGNQPPEQLADVSAAASDRLVNNPWSEDARASVRDAAASGGDVLLIGTGLTMIDTVLSLTAAGHRGRIVALSRRGQIPKAHADFTPAPIAEKDVPTGDLMGLWRWLRRRSGEVGWRSAVDSLRPHSQALWQGLSDAQQRRFLRHARPYWDVHRHRIAPEVARRIAGLIGEGRLEVAAGRIADLRPAHGGLEVQIKRRGAGPPPSTQLRTGFDKLGTNGCPGDIGEHELGTNGCPGDIGEHELGTNGSCRFAFVFNCTGPLGSIGRTSDAMLRQMLDDGLVRPDHLGIGLEVDGRSRAAGAERLWALGPLTKGRYWEIVAVPDIREQAAAVAEDIAQELES